MTSDHKWTYFIGFLCDIKYSPYRRQLEITYMSHVFSRPISSNWKNL